MSNAKNNTGATPKDVADKALAEKLVVPAQGNVEITDDGVTVTTSEPKTDGSVDSGSGEKTKKSYKDRLAGVTAKLKENKKTLVMVGATIAVATLAFAKYAKKQAEQALTEASDEETVTEDQEKLILDDMAAGDIGG